MSEQIIPINEKVKLWCETAGDPKNPPVLMIAGAKSLGISVYSEAFCSVLKKNYYVIRFDHRDIGCSTCFDFEKEPYTLLDLTTDVKDLLKALKIDTAHILGNSMGGYIAQLLAIHHPEYLSSLTILSSCPDFSPAINAMNGKKLSETSLPPPHQSVLELLRVSPSSYEEMVEHQLKYWQVLNGNKIPFDVKRYQEQSKKMSDHVKNPKAASNHNKAIGNTPLNLIDPLKQVNIKTLVIHGSEDPVFPLPHAETIANVIPNAKLLVIKNMAHMIASDFWDEILHAISDHLLFASLREI